MSFAIIISEKGGAERREHFDKSEIVVGRLQGNDLMLQKSNVSKRHARLLFSNGRFIVSDLESTNGTYVNGRKIAKATVVREGDKIYVGDFVLRFEAAPGVSLAPESSPSAPGPREATAAELSQVPSVPSPAQVPARGEASSQFPLEGDEGPKISIPAAPRLPSNVPHAAPRGGTQAMPSMVAPSVVTPSAAAVSVVAPSGGSASIAAPPLAASPAAPPLSMTPAPPPQGPSTDGGNPHIQALAQAVVGRGVTMSPPSPTPGPHSPDLGLLGSPSSLRPSTGQHPTRSAAAITHRLALASLVEAVGGRVDLSSLAAGAWPIEQALGQRIGQALRDALPQLRRDGDIPDSVDQAALLRDAQLELLGLGPLGPLLDDDDVSVIQVTHHDHISVQRGAAASLSSVEPGFSSPEALRRTIARLCAQSGQPLGPHEAVVERRGPRAHLLAVLPPVASAPTATLRRRAADAPTDDPVRVGVISRVAWNFLAQCVAARLNVLVVAPPESGPVLLGPLLSTLPADERLAVLQAPEAAIAAPAHALSLQVEGASSLLGTVGRMSLDRAVLSSLPGPALADALDVLGGRAVALLASTPGGSLRQTTTRLVAELCAARPGLSAEVAREWLGASFDLAIEVGRLRDGRLRVLRVAESAHDAAGQPFRDIFVALPDRSGEPVLGSTGHVPRAADELRVRGFPVDTNIFERSSGR